MGKALPILLAPHYFCLSLYGLRIAKSPLVYVSSLKFNDLTEQVRSPHFGNIYFEPYRSGKYHCYFQSTFDKLPAEGCCQAP